MVSQMADIIRLESKIGKSNKFYEAEVVKSETSDLYNIYCSYGPIGGNAYKYLYCDPQQYANAIDIRDAIIKGKLKRGYSYATKTQEAILTPIEVPAEKKKFTATTQYIETESKEEEPKEPRKGRFSNLILD